MSEYKLLDPVLVAPLQVRKLQATISIDELMLSSNGGVSVRLASFPTTKVIFDRILRFPHAVIVRRMWLPDNYLAVISMQMEAILDNNADKVRVDVHNKCSLTVREYLYNLVECPPCTAFRIYASAASNTKASYFEFTGELQIEFSLAPEPLSRDLMKALQDPLHPG
jgi:hypothetical protein